MKIKKIVSQVFLVAFFILVYITFYRPTGNYMTGEWFAVDAEKNQIKIKITKNSIEISQKGEETRRFFYKQIGSGSEKKRYKVYSAYNEIEFDKNKYTFILPNRKNKKYAVIIEPYKEGNPTVGETKWVLSKHKYVQFYRYQK